ncbi:MAG: sulfurtransferase [Propionibacteriaceae bacterium]|jgi:thiosulfate/3-mercaptopyruvate sulfurtransferase|nr:sulfurtransferase [Propionibacteriaceae bacterium]
MRNRDELLVTPTELRRLLHKDDVLILDVRWALGATGKHEEYLAGHVPGAVWVDLDADLASAPSRADGRHPLPSPGAFQTTARRWGLNRGDSVVVYDERDGVAASRVWWLLNAAGFPDVRILDGGLSAWVAEAGELEPGEAGRPAGDVVLGDFIYMPHLDMKQVADYAGVLLDGRSRERFRGEEEPVDSQPGHIPGAKNAPVSENLNPDGTFKDASKLAVQYAELGAKPGVETVVYCGSGVSACNDIFALALAGVDAALYPGSWSQWSASHMPVAVGD